MLNIREEIMSDEFTKHHIEGLPFNAVLHHFTAPDKGGVHCHPFGFMSIVLHGSYVERVYDPIIWYKTTITRKKGDVFFIDKDHMHEIVSLPDGGCYTLILPDKWEKEPRFWKVQGNNVYSRQWNETEFKLYKT